MAYERINWEDYPSTQTPINAENLNNMDSALATLDGLITSAESTITQLQQMIDLIEARIDTIVSRPDGATGIYNIVDGTTIGSARTLGAVDSGNNPLGQYAFGEGLNSIASGSASHAEGYGTLASGSIAHAEGDSTTASGDSSHAEGHYTIANHKSQHVFGEFNIEDPSIADAALRGNYVEIVGNGANANANARSNARTLDWQGNEKLAGGLTLGMGTANEVTITPAQLAALLNLLN